MKSKQTTLGAAFILALGSYALAGSVTTVQTDGTGTVTYNSSTGVLSATNIPINAAVLINGTNIPANFSFTAQLDTTGAGTGVIGPFTFLYDDITSLSFSITQGSTNVLSGTASAASLTDFFDSFTISAEIPTDTLAFASDIISSANDQADSLQILFANSSSDPDGDPASLNGDNFSDFTAELGTNSFSANISATNSAPVPLPASAISGATLLTGLGLTKSTRLRRKAR